MEDAEKLRNELFVKTVSENIRRVRPTAKVATTPGDLELTIDGRRLDLENLKRMIEHDPAMEAQIIQHYIEQLFGKDTAQAQSSWTLTEAKPHIMPRIQPESIFEHLSRDQVAHIPFVNDTAIVYVIDLPHMTISVTTEQMTRWKLDIDSIDEIARHNLNNYAPELEVSFVESKEGGLAAIFAQHDGYDATRILLDDLHGRLCAKLGNRFNVAIPARDMFVAFTEGPDAFITRLQERVDSDFKRLPYPISPKFFLATMDGIAGTEIEKI